MTNTPTTDSRVGDERLAKLLELVQGADFVGTGSSSEGWADKEEAISLIEAVDAALSRRSLDDGVEAVAVIRFDRRPGHENDMPKVVSCNWLPDGEYPVYLTSPAQETVTDAARDLLAERQRQVMAEGWTPEHDDAHDRGELAKAAGVYTLAAASHDYRYVLNGLPVNDYLAATFKMWPWDWGWFKPKDRRRDLVKAGALILAEIERLDRAALSSKGA